MQSSADVTKTKISKELLERLEACQRIDQTHPNSREWTEEEDEILRRYWGKIKQTDIAEIIGTSSNTCRKRWRELCSKTQMAN